MQRPQRACKTAGSRQIGAMKNRNMRRILAVLVMLLPLPAAAQVVTTLERSAPDPARLDIVAGGNGSIGLRVRLAPGWKFYWRTPGEGGVPPQFDWTGRSEEHTSELQSLIRTSYSVFCL